MSSPSSPDDQGEEQVPTPRRAPRDYLEVAHTALSGAMNGYDAMIKRGRDSSIQDLLAIVQAQAMCGILAALANFEDLVREDLANEGK